MNSIPSYMKPVNIPHDPVPNHSFILYPYQTFHVTQKQAIQGHLVEHGIADFWLKPDQPHVLAGIFDEEEQMKAIWNQWLQIQCPRWSRFNLPEIKPEKRQRCSDDWEKEKKKRSGHVCFNCIADENGKDRFDNCWNILEPYRIEFLKQLKKWIVESIQDNNMNSFYQTGVLPKKGGSPARRHIHITANNYDLKSYVIENRDNGRFDVFCMVFQSADDKRYYIRTCYGIGIAYSEEGAKWVISNKVRQSNEYWMKRIFGYCHPLNWKSENAKIQKMEH